MSDALAYLDPDQRRRLAELTETFRALGAGDPEGWAASEVTENIPQLARFLFLRRLWSGGEQWTLPPGEWFAEVEEDDDEPALEEDDDEPTLVRPSPDDADAGDDDGDPPFLAAQQAVERILVAGVSADDLREVARAVFIYATFDACQTIDEGHDPHAEPEMPGWLLTEVGADLVLTGRMLDGLHEDLLTVQPEEAGGV